MELYSLQFLILLLVSLAVYYTIGKNYQWICLLVVSGLFYLWTGNGNFIFILLTGMSTWGAARAMEYIATTSAIVRKNGALDKDEKKRIKKKTTSQRKAIMLSVVMLNFGILAYIKYWNTNSFLMSLGISFYTFQSIGYLLDIYYEKYKCEKNPAKYMLFVSFFPQMIQGPINRFEHMREQFFSVHSMTFEQAERSIYKIFYGLLKKYAIANVLAPLIVEILDGEIDNTMPGSVIVFGIFLYSIQQYADFSGGIDMVMGIAMLFGIEMMPNFRQPYFSTSLADFWRRWHISLGKWMRDYVFYPFALTKPMKKLGKWANNKLGKHLGRVLPAMLGNIVVFFTVGIWHGSQLHYILWGLYNGLVIAFSDLFAPLYAKLASMLKVNVKAKGFYIFQILRTFIIVNIGWYFDRIEDVGKCFQYLGQTVTYFCGQRFLPVLMRILQDYSIISVMLAFLATGFVFFVSVLREKQTDMYVYLHRVPIVIRWGIYYLVILLILFSFFAASDAGGFMYANF